MKNLMEKVLSVLDFFIPKDENLIVFGGNELRGINGNVAAVLKAWPKSTKTGKFKSYVISVHREKFAGVKTIDPRTLEGVIVILRSGTAVVSHVYGDLYWHTLYNGKRRRIINLWHGAPLKRIGPWRGWGKTTALIAASKLEKLALSACIELPLENIYLTGFPRTDMLINSSEKLKRRALESLKIKESDQKFILYTPTYRKSSGVESYLHRMPDFSYKDLEQFLKKRNAILIGRSHINYQFSDFKPSERVKFADFKSMKEIEPLYALADILINDFSSSMFEYLNLNRPIVGFAPDLDEYNRVPGLLFDYRSIFPGPVAKDWYGLKKLLDEALKEPVKYSQLREDRKKLFNELNDGKATGRVIDLITNLSIK